MVAELTKTNGDRRAQETADDAPDLVEVELGSMNDLGDTTAEFEGRTINVAGGIPGERVVVRVHRYRRRRRDHVSAIVYRVLEASLDRVTPKCGYYGTCSGCQWQHINYSAQLTLKRKVVERHLRRFPSLSHLSVAPTIPADRTYYYRNHARFTVRRDGQLGFSNRITRRFVRIEHCMLMDQAINDAVTEFQDRAAETTNMSIRVGANTGDVLIQPTFQRPDIRLQSGQTHYRERLHGREFRVASPSFFQVNTAQAERLIEVVRSGLDLAEDDVLVDAYAGVGVFAILLAPHVARSIAIEESASAVHDGMLNADGLDNVEFIQLKTEEALNTLSEVSDLDSPPDVVILDPPRVGCHPEALDALLGLAPHRIAYVSCDPPSLARDLDILGTGGYEITHVQPIDMFPQTYHVESVSILRRRDALPPPGERPHGR